MKIWSVVLLLLSPAEAEKPVGYANPELIVETEWLSARP